MVSFGLERPFFVKAAEVAAPIKKYLRFIRTPA